MAKSVTLTPRIGDIAAKIRGACATITDSEDAKSDLQSQLNAAAEDNRNTRLTAMLAVADLSAQGNWLPGEITAACKAAAGMGNRDDKTAKSLATFISEMKVPADPSVRGHFAAIVSAAETAWATETEAYKADKNTPTPLRKLWARSYHMITGLSRVSKERGTPIATVDAIVAYAVANDPDLDADKVEKRLKAVAATLQGIYQDFPNDDIKACVEYLELLKPADLMAARKAVHGVDTTTTVVTAPATVVATTPAAVVSDTVEPAAGASDILGEILGEIAGDEIRLAA